MCEKQIRSSFLCDLLHIFSKENFPYAFSACFNQFFLSFVWLWQYQKSNEKCRWCWLFALLLFTIVCTRHAFDGVDFWLFAPYELHFFVSMTLQTGCEWASRFFLMVLGLNWAFKDYAVIAINVKQIHFVPDLRARWNRTQLTDFQDDYYDYAVERPLIMDHILCHSIYFLRSGFDIDFLITQFKTNASIIESLFWHSAFNLFVY